MKQLLFCCLLFVVACKSKTAKVEPKKNDTIVRIPAPVIPPSPNIADTLYVDTTAVVFCQPDSIQMEKWKKDVGEKDFETVIDDWSFYIMSAKEFVTSTKVKMEMISNKKAIKFLKQDGSASVVCLDTLRDFWAAWMFRPVKDPKETSIVDMELSFKEYFK